MTFSISPIIIIMIICFSPSLYSMDPETPPIDNAVAWTVVLTHGVEWFDYIKINSLVVSKGHQLLLCNTAPCRKNYMLQKTQSLKQEKDIVWNTYGTMCGIVEFRPTWYKKHFMQRYHEEKYAHLHIGKELLTTRFYLAKPVDFRCHMHLPCSVMWSDFHSCLPHLPQPFFNEKSDFCFYGYGVIGYKGSCFSGSVRQYCLGVSHKPWECYSRKTACVANIKGKDSQFINLKIFLEFPVLLAAFLNSSIVVPERGLKQEGMFYCEREYINVYAIEGVTIPDNYTDYKQYFSTPHYTCYNDLPRCVRQVIFAKRLVQRHAPIKK